MLDAVYVDARKTKSIVAIQPKSPFKPIFQVAVTRQNSEIRIINEPLKDTSVFLVDRVEESALSSLGVDFPVKERRDYALEFMSSQDI